MKLDTIGFLCTLLVALVHCDQNQRDLQSALVVSDLEALDNLHNEQIAKRDSLDNFNHDVGLNIETRSRIDRMPAIFGKRSRLNRMPAVFGKRSRLNRMPAVFGKRSRISRMPAVFGKRSKISRMPTYFGKRSKLNRMPAVFGKRDSPTVVSSDFQTRDILPEDFLGHIKSDKLTVEEIADLIGENMYLLVPMISQLLDKNNDGYVSVEELKTVFGNDSV